MLFNLSCQRHFPNSRTGKEIWCGTKWGPTYGDDELSANTQPFNGENKCRSIAGKPYYRIPEEGEKNTLTNKKGNTFTITELEVWSIKEIVRNLIFLINIGRMKNTREKTHTVHIIEHKYLN